MFRKGQTGVYFHWPFCLAKCPYCDFNVHVRDDVDAGVWEAAYLKALESYAAAMPDRTVSSVFFGGGTPSLIPPAMIGRLLDKIHQLWPCVNDLEVTLEANPTSVEAKKFAAFKEAGVNRVSMGVQALDDAELKFLGRRHTLDEALAAIEIAGDLFDRFSFDLIYARPQQTLEIWEAELRRAAGLAKGHLSLYQLTIERNTPFYFDHEQGKFSIPKDDLAADFYLLTQSVMRELGLPIYEVSNHAAGEAQQSRHNLLYWHYGEYIGIGPGAHGRIDLEGGRYATRDHQAPESWLNLVERQGSGAHPYQLLSLEEQVLEALMMGLRLADGIGLENFKRFGAAEWSDIVDMKQLRVFESEGWLRADEANIALSDEGLLRLNSIVPRLARERPRLDLMRFQGAA